MKDSSQYYDFQCDLSSERIFIRNMVCKRCILATEQIFLKAGIDTFQVLLGEVKILSGTLNPAKLQQLDGLLQEFGLERICDPRLHKVEQIKSLIIEYIHYHNLSEMRVKWSHYLESQMGYDFDYLSKLFSTANGITLEHYIIRQKVERVKHLLVNHRLALKDIAYLLGYKNTTHISSQFKKITGITISQFRRNNPFQALKALDEIT